jgi:hypothetical protein
MTFLQPPFNFLSVWWEFSLQHRVLKHSIFEIRGCHNCDVENSSLLGCYAISSDRVIEVSKHQGDFIVRFKQSWTA